VNSLAIAYLANFVESESFETRCQDFVDSCEC